MGGYAYIVFRTKKDNIYTKRSIVYYDQWKESTDNYKLFEFIEYSENNTDHNIYYNKNAQLVNFVNMVVEYYEYAKNSEGGSIGISMCKLKDLGKINADYYYYITWNFDAKKLTISVNDEETDGYALCWYENIFGTYYYTGK